MRIAIIFLAVAGLVAAGHPFDEIPECATCAACKKKTQQTIGTLAKDCVVAKCGIFKALETKDKAKKMCNDLWAKGESY